MAILQGEFISSSGLAYYDGKLKQWTSDQITDNSISVEKEEGYDNHLADKTIHITSTERTTWNGKQDALTTTQLNAVNSGITSTKVSTYDGYATNKQNALSTAQLNAVNSGITSSKVSTYDGYASKINNKLDTSTASSTYVTKANAITSLSVNGKTITITKGDSKTSTITTQDTTYDSLTLDVAKQGTETTNKLVSAKVLVDTIKDCISNNVPSNVATKETTLSGYGITDAYTKDEVDQKVSDLVSSAPQTLDTLNELASALGNDPNFATTVSTEIGKKANATDLTTHTTNNNIHITSTERTTWNNKQNALTETQLSAINSGITSDLVSKIGTVQALTEEEILSILV